MTLGFCFHQSEAGTQSALLLYPGGGHGEPVTAWWSVGAPRQGHSNHFGGKPKLGSQSSSSSSSSTDALPPMACDLIHLVQCADVPALFQRLSDQQLAYTGPSPCATVYPPVSPDGRPHVPPVVRV